MANSFKILVVDDNKGLGMILKSFLISRGYSCVLCNNGSEAMKLISKDSINMLITDVVLPGMTGHDLVRHVRKTDNCTPIIFLSEKSLHSDIIQGFELGADDYVTKPFNMDELALRIEAIRRRVYTGDRSQSIYKIGLFLFDSSKRKIYISGNETSLTAKETDLLSMFCENTGRVVERSNALKIIWKEDNYFTARNMDVYVGRLRNILKADPNVALENVHGVGYKLIINTMNINVCESMTT